MILLQICLLGLVVSDNSTISDRSITEDTSEVSNIGNNPAVDAVDQVKRLFLTSVLYRSQLPYSAVTYAVGFSKPVQKVILRFLLDWKLEESRSWFTQEWWKGQNGSPHARPRDSNSVFLLECTSANRT